ncbi:calcium-activated chloride channel regulator 1-like [Trichosurus vulpecula]|uniref:calcium-activated chloride channel regulator 1-like n=1 Tax=Trichosurus vulpecula TaxID=9337 RepID=UPI00186AF1F0|nr:calcium-activated chloride channel regulator 1-like [Trichosurus vulpecula]
MGSFPNVFLILASGLLQAVEGSMIQLNDNGYDGVVIAINPSVPEDEKLIQKAKEMVTEASTFLFSATRKRAYFRNVSILIPMTWTSKPEYLTPTLESYEQADVIVADSYLKYGNDPYTLQYGQCGEKGRYIHLTPNFLLDDNKHIYGSRGKVLVHEWAHLRWGVFDEYNLDQPFYITSQNKIEATRCSRHITGVNRVLKCSKKSCAVRQCKTNRQTGMYETKCQFIPEKSQKAKASIMFMQSLDSVAEFCTAKTHNPEAPNLQNKMCNQRSTWEVIMDSEDFRNVSLMAGTNSPPPPTFSLLKTKEHIVCLILDKSGSMSTKNRLSNLVEAAELYLIQIVEMGSWVGMVTFDSDAEIQNNLTQIVPGNATQEIIERLPKVANGGTSICGGLRAGFQVITQSNRSISGSEIVLLTDGEDSEISTCFNEVKQSGAVIHTVALGPDASRDLEKLSLMTGGYSVTPKDRMIDLLDAFSRITSRSGDLSQKAIQLESKSVTLSSKEWMNGTVIVDSTVGNDTFFVITWTENIPSIYLQDPKGKEYRNADFSINKLNSKAARLRIPKTAETGNWIYKLQNEKSLQTLTLTVTTRAKSPTVLPVIATVHVNQSTGHFPSPMTVYAQVSQGFLPVLGAKVTAVIETEGGLQETLALWDNGAGADTVKNDGIYSRYFTSYHENGRYSLKVLVQARNNTARISMRSPQSRAMYVPGYVDHGKIILNPPRPEVKGKEMEVKIEDFGRVTSGDSFILAGVPSGSIPDKFPPNKITDLKAKFQADHILLSWTAPGDDYDKGKADHYRIRMSENSMQLRDHFDKATPVDTSGLMPKEANFKEAFKFKPETLKIKNGTKVYIAIQAVDQANLTSEISNIAQAVKFLPPCPCPVPSTEAPSPNNSISYSINVATVIWAVVGAAATINIF